MNLELKEDSYFDHDADIGIIGRGRSLEESFEDAARSMFSLMTDLTEIQELQNWVFEFDETDPELALVIWLNFLLAFSNADQAIFSRFILQRSANHWQGKAYGQVWQLGMPRGIDVKGATLTMLSVKQINDHWEARCVIDV